MTTKHTLLFASRAYLLQELEASLLEQQGKDTNSSQDVEMV
jgi:hypothetical protein